jgi:hypothetical protein
VQFTESGNIAPNQFGSYGAGHLATTIDTLRLTLTRGDATGIAVDNIAVVPAPGALALLAGAGLVAARRRR